MKVNALHTVAVLLAMQVPLANAFRASSRHASSQGSSVASQVVSLTKSYGAPTQVEFERIVGCYAVTVGPWSGGFPSGSPAMHQPPSIVRIDSAFTPNERSRLLYRTLAPNIPALVGLRNVQPGWQTAGTDSVVMHWSSGFAGVQINVGLHGDSLVGTAQAFHDVIGPVQPRAHVTMRRIECTGGLLHSTTDLQTRTVFGRVVDGETAKPLSQVRVMISGMPLGVVTNDSGLFELRSVPSSAAELTFDHTCYLKVRVSLSTIDTIAVAIGLPFEVASRQRFDCGGLAARRKL